MTIKSFYIKFSENVCNNITHLIPGHCVFPLGISITLNGISVIRCIGKKRYNKHPILIILYMLYQDYYYGTAVVNWLVTIQKHLTFWHKFVLLFKNTSWKCSSNKEPEIFLTNTSITTFVVSWIVSPCPTTSTPSREIQYPVTASVECWIISLRRTTWASTREI